MAAGRSLTDFSSSQTQLQQYYGFNILCVKMQSVSYSTAYDCLPAQPTGSGSFTCPGGLNERVFCYGNSYFGTPPPANVQEDTASTCGNGAGKDKCGKWASKKCEKKKKRGKCRKRKVQKKCGYTCAAEIQNNNLGSNNPIDSTNAGR